MSRNRLTVMIGKVRVSYGYRHDNGRWHWRMNTTEVCELLERGDVTEVRALEYMIGEQVRACEAQLGLSRYAWDNATLAHRKRLKASRQFYQERHAMVKAWLAEHKSMVYGENILEALKAAQERIVMLEREVARLHDAVYYQ